MTTQSIPFLSLGRICFTVVIAAIFACSLRAPDASAQSVLIKVSRTTQRNINIVASKRGISTGITSLDDINKQNGVVRMERVFRNAGKFEARHRAYGLDRWYKLVYSISSDEVAVLEQYRQVAGIEEVELNQKRKLFRGIRNPDAESSHREAIRALSPNDPSFDTQWQYNNSGQTGGSIDADIDLSEAWELTTGNSTVIVSVLDSGVDLNHPDLEANIWTNPGEIAGNGIDDDQNGFVDDVHGWDFSDNDNNPDDEDGHGSHTAGTIAAATNNALGVAGIAGGYGGSGVQIMPLKIFENALGDIIAEAFVYAADNGAVISSNSWGGGDPSSIIENAIDYFIANAGSSAGPVSGGVVVFASGNDGTDSQSLGYPATYPPVIAVAASDHSDRLPDWSNYGSWVDITAPGVSILSTTNNGGYESWDGTSMAAPHVAGVAALIASYAPGLTSSELRNAVESSADNIDALNPGRVGLLGSGRLNAHNALIATVPPPPDNTAPGAIANLSVAARGSTSLTLQWSATGDDGSDGRASSYDVRVLASASSDPVSSPAISGAPSPSTAGSLEPFTVPGLRSETDYFFALRAIDEAGNEGPFSNVASGRTIAAPSISLNPVLVEASVDGGGSTSRTVTLRNTGGNTITVSLSVIDGPATAASRMSSSVAHSTRTPFLSPMSRLRTARQAKEKNLKRDRIYPRSSIVRLSGGDILVWDADGLSGTGENLDSILGGLGYRVDFTTSLQAAGDLSGYLAVFVSLGIYPNNHELNRSEGNSLAAYLDAGGGLYLEGADTWAWDPLRSVHNYFGISGTDDGINDLNFVTGVSGTMAAGIEMQYRTDFTYGDYIDRLQATGSAVVVLENADENYGVGIAHDAGTYRTFGTSFALGAASSDTGMVYDVVEMITEFLTGSSTQSGPWLTISPEEVTLSSGASASILLEISADGLLAGGYSAIVKAHIDGEDVSLDRSADVVLSVLTDDPDGGTGIGDGDDAVTEPVLPSIPDAPIAHFLPGETLYSEGDLVAEWPDMSGNSHDATQEDFMSQPFFTENGPGAEPAIIFDGISHLAIANNEDMNSAGPYSEKTVALVFTTGFDVTSRQVLFEEGAASRGLSIYLYNGALYMNAWNLKRDEGNAPWGPVYVSEEVSSLNTYQVSFTLDAAAGEVKGRINGNSTGSAAGAGLLFRHNGRIGLGGMNYGSRFHDRKGNGTGFGFDGIMSEFLYYDRILSATEYSGLEAYFEAKYWGGSPSANGFAEDNVSEIETLSVDTDPSELSLKPNYPNPFNPTTSFEYRIPESASVRVVIYNTLGQVVRVIVDAHQNAGQYTAQWDGRDNSGVPVASGIYLYRIQAGQLTQSRTMLLLK